MLWQWAWQSRIVFFIQQRKARVTLLFMLAQELAEMEYTEQQWLRQILMRTRKKKNQRFRSVTLLLKNY